MKYSFLLIDLDDTLAPEWDFVSGGYRAAAALMAGTTGEDEARVYNRFVYQHMKYGRAGIMQRMSNDAELASELVVAYRNHTVEMRFCPGAREALTKLREGGARLAVVTDGALEMQKCKAASLGLSDLVETIVYCAELDAPKPDPAGFADAMAQLGAVASETLIIGDDPLHDIEAARRLEVAACRVRTGKYALVEGCAPTVGDLPAFADFPDWLEEAS